MLRIESYYATLDSGELEQATDMLAESVSFVMIVPTGARAGTGRAAMLDYLTGRPPVGRQHRLLRRAQDGDVQFAQGAVTEHGDVVTGYFVAAMHLDENGLIDRYQVSFDPAHALVPWAGSDAPSTDPTGARR